MNKIFEHFKNAFNYFKNVDTSTIIIGPIQMPNSKNQTRLEVLKANRRTISNRPWKDLGLKHCIQNCKRNKSYKRLSNRNKEKFWNVSRFPLKIWVYHNQLCGKISPIRSTRFTVKSEQNLVREHSWPIYTRSKTFFWLLSCIRRNGLHKPFTNCIHLMYRTDKSISYLKRLNTQHKLIIICIITCLSFPLLNCDTF